MATKLTKHKGISFHLKTGKHVRWDKTYELAVAHAVDDSMFMKKPTTISVVAETLAAARWWRRLFHNQPTTSAEYERLKGKPIEVLVIAAKPGRRASR